MNSIYCIVNPASANGKTARYWPEIENKIKIRNLNYDYYITEAPYQATLETRRALEYGYHTIVSIGGDGTLNEVVNGFFRNGTAINPDASLAVVSSGTGRDFIRSSGIPDDIRSALNIICRGQTRSIDLGHIRFHNIYRRKEERYFINVAGFGVDGEIVDRVNNASKYLGGFYSFLKGTLLGLLLYRNKKVSMTLDGKMIYAGGILSGIVANGQYIGSGMHIAPDADLADGLFDVIIIGEMTKRKTIASVPRLYKGTHLNLPEVQIHRGAHLLVSTVDRVKLNLDGEQPGFLDAEFTVKPRAIKLLC